MNLELETNARNPLDLDFHLPSGAVLMLTASGPDAGWRFRVRLTPTLALLAVPQFGGTDFCLRAGSDIVLCLPYETPVAELIKRMRKRVPSGRETQFKAAVMALQREVTRWRLGKAKRS